MDAIILAAGRGSRMGSLTAELPKCMTRFENRPLLDWQLAALRAGGTQRVAVVAGTSRKHLTLTAASRTQSFVF